MLTESQNRLMAFDSELRAERPIVASEPVMSSAGSNWRGFLLEYHRVNGQELYDARTPYTIIGLHIGNPTRVEVKDEKDGAFEEKIFQPGDITIIPAGTEYSIRFTEPAEFMLMSLENTLLDQARRSANGDTSELKITWCLRDNFIRETIQDLRAVVEHDRSTDKMYAETLVNSLALHVVRNLKSGNNRAKGRGRHGLTRTQLENTISFIRDTPYRQISLTSMANAAGLSPFHFSRMFKLSTGLSPHQFVLKRRLDIGADLLTKGSSAISDIASELGFADQSHFTMHFKRLFGQAPAAYRRKKRARN